MNGESDVDAAVRDECNTVEMVACCQFEEGTEDQEAKKSKLKVVVRVVLQSGVHGRSRSRSPSSGESDEW